jgi:hypothetical protein
MTPMRRICTDYFLWGYPRSSVQSALSAAYFWVLRQTPRLSPITSMVNELPLLLLRALLHNMIVCIKFSFDDGFLNQKQFSMVFVFISSANGKVGCGREYDDNHHHPL